MSLVEILFIGVGVLSVAAAVGMLLTKKAVHSALFLIANFTCVAIIYLMLNASFLAMVQIAVYAGAIMVLFLFVIMLLGAENPSAETKEFKWLTPTTLLLAMGFLGIVALALLGSGINTQETQPAKANLRFVNALSVYPNADFYLDGVLFAGGVSFGESDGTALPFAQVEPGTYSVGVNLANTKRTPLPIGEVTVGDGETITVVAYGLPGTDINPTIAVVNEDISASSARIGRLTIVNAHAPAQTISILDAGADRIFRDAAEVEGAPVIVHSLPVGGFVTFAEEAPGLRNWVITDAVQKDDVLVRLSGVDANSAYEIEAGQSQLLIYTTDRQGDFVTSRTMNVVTPHEYAFGSPQALGALLFIDYLLPFQMVGILLLTSMAGAIVVAQRTISKPKPGRPTRRKVSRPLTSVITSQTGTDVTLGEDVPQLTAPEETAEPVGD
ncbi:MAG: NADH-quinone oxidoreductase subunit J [bacterium]|nr:NADH-quinone oxidoreductase subunit J [bacterium]